MSDNQVIAHALNALIKKEVHLVLYGEHVFGSYIGELDAVVGKNNYILRVKRDDVTVRFSVYKIDGIDTNDEGISTIYALVDQQPKLEGV